jgi:hypothetical protein
MRKLLLAGAATIGVIAAPAVLSAQDTDAEIGVAADAELSAEQQVIYDAWPVDRRADYDALEPEYQTYFWTLTPRQRDAYWVLTPEQRAQMMEMTPQARANAWSSIEAQLAADANASETSVAARTGGDVPAPRTAAEANAQAAPPPASVTSGASAVVTTYPGNLTAPPPSALNKTYPVCTARLQDSCQNPGEGGAPGRSRALPYWPGEPASERD